MGHSNDLPTLLDRSLQRFERIWAAAGTPESVFSMSPGQLQTITSGRWLDFAQD